ncbi:hypothetical protein [Streptomyces sp. SBT349]|uniref:hypothetical protein n=1 Tax=Streptomyces sp. SBT349 TaxID=1580539 RepID=UPI00066B693D|nr:hypothetical protein [Streptomyces sp. SBT349]
MPSTLTAGRGAAVFIGVGTLGNLVITDVDGEFVVPDLIVGLALLIAAVLPRDQATSALTAAFGMASGVFAVAAFSYVERGDIGPGVTLFALTSLALTVLLAWRVGLPTENGAEARSSRANAHA